MVKRRMLAIIWLIDGFTIFIQGQTVNSPNFALKSHETLDILKIETTQKATVIFLSIENRREGGSFCADKNIYAIYSDGTRNKLISSKGIPVCPGAYKFKTIGEKLSFELTFEPLKPGTKWIDLVEDCNDNCFSFYGVCLNTGLNIKIDEASVLAESGESSKALAGFLKIANSEEIKGSGLEGLIEMNIIKLSKETGNSTEAAKWYGKLKSSEIPHSGLYIKHLNSQGISY
jgi:hypothetical protein